MVYLLLLLLIILFNLIYNRYFPIYGMECTDLQNKSQVDEDVILIDLRDYNISTKNPISEAINIPIAYLKRYYRDIHAKKVHVIASDQLEKNMGIRFLRKKGFKISSYSLTNCNCNDRNIAV